MADSFYKHKKLSVTEFQFINSNGLEMLFIQACSYIIIGEGEKFLFIKNVKERPEFFVLGTIQLGLNQG